MRGPQVKPPRTRQHPEKAIEADLITALRRMGFRVTKTSQPRASMVTPGIPDLYAVHPAWGLRVWVEVKAPGGKVSHAQAVWHEGERAAGGTVLVIRSVGELVEELRALGAPIQ